MQATLPFLGSGTSMGVPTINLAPYEDQLPSNGVYLTTLKIGSELQIGSELPIDECPTTRLFRGLTNIGNRPTFGADSFAVETHLLDFHPIDLTEHTPLELTFLHRLRDERRFPSPEALREQIGKDVQRARRYFRLADALGIRL